MPTAIDQIKLSDSGESALGPVSDLDLVDDELLIEEISIDGMCGVY